MIWTWVRLGAVVNTQSILVYSQTKAIMEVNSLVEVTLQNENPT